MDRYAKYPQNDIEYLQNTQGHIWLFKSLTDK